MDLVRGAESTLNVGGVFQQFSSVSSSFRKWGVYSSTKNKWDL